MIKHDEEVEGFDEILLVDDSVCGTIVMIESNGQPFGHVERADNALGFMYVKDGECR